MQVYILPQLRDVFIPSLVQSLHMPRLAEIGRCEEGLMFFVMWTPSIRVSSTPRFRPARPSPYSGGNFSTAVVWWEDAGSVWTSVEMLETWWPLGC